MVGFAEKLKEQEKLNLSQSRLSQFETRPEGPPLEIVKEYAEFFKLKGEARFDFFLAALEASDPIEIDILKVHPIFQDILRKYIALTLANESIGKILQNCKDIPDYTIRLDEYTVLEETWKKLGDVLETLLKEAHGK
jgi:hypothetical protein